MPNPVISSITLPSGNTYDLKDAAAREAIAGLTGFELIICTSAANTPKDVTWESGGTTITGTLEASADTKGAIYLVPSTNGTKDIYDEYVTVNTGGTTYIWELFGNTDVHIGDLGALAFKSSASGSFTPAGSVSVSASGTENKTATVAPAQSGEATYTPAGTVAAPTISKKTAGSTSTIKPVTNAGSLPSLTATVVNEVLTLAFDAGALPTLGNDLDVKTGDAEYEASAPAFTGQGARLVTDNIPVPNAFTGAFTGAAGTVNVS